MKGWRFALSGRWAGYFALVIVFSVISVMFGNWQFDRRAEARAAIELVEANYDREPLPVSSVLSSLNAYEPSQQWTPVVLTGRYLSDEEMLARNRPYSGHPGFEVLTPLLLDDGTIFIVNRGWVPIGERQDAPDVVPQAPEGPVTVIARLTAGEPVLAGRTSPKGTNQVATIHLPEIAERLDRETYSGAYGLVAEQMPEPETQPVTTPKPDPDEGPHLSYALQWYVFALLAFIGLGWALQQEYRVINADDPRVIKSAAQRDHRRSKRKASDAEVEDALMDHL